MLDVAIRGGMLVDGTGTKPRKADIGISAGRIVSIGPDVGVAKRQIDATDLMVAPGFIDLHTHYDAQVFWDRAVKPSILHGVTTIIGGNCGFSIAPLAEHSKNYMLNMLARVEGMSAEALEAGVPWDWRSTEDFLTRLDGKLVPNSGWLTGHSALRTYVMAGDAQKPASPAQVEAMKALLEQSLKAGSLGFSSTWSTAHNDHRGDPVPSRFSSKEEIIALCEVVGKYPGTTLEFIGSVKRFDEKVFDVMADMSNTANRPLNWNALMVEGNADEFISHQLSADDYARKRGGRIIALTPTDSRRHMINLRTGFMFDALPGWDKFISLSPDERITRLRDPAYAKELDRLAQTMEEGFLRRIVDWGSLLLAQTFTPRYEEFVGATFGEIGRKLGQSAWDSFVQINLADELRTVAQIEGGGQDSATWNRRLALWRDKRAIVGASDAGAHLDMADSFNYTTVLLGKAVRDVKLLSIEEAVSFITKQPADLYGLKDRGTIREGAWGDIVIFDPATIGAEPVRMVFDLPAGAGRLFGAATGIKRILVNGIDAVIDGEVTEASPGHVLRSGRDTSTVTAH